MGEPIGNWDSNKLARFVEDRIPSPKPKKSVEKLPVENQQVVGAFQNSWVPYDSVRVPRFYKDPYGRVHLSGTIKAGTIGTTAFVLPAGYRPRNADSTSTLNFVVNSNNAFGVVSIASNGNVTPGVGSNVFVFLDGISFLA